MALLKDVLLTSYYHVVDLLITVASIEPFRRVVELLAAGLVGVVLSDVFAEGPRPSGVKIAATFVATFVVVALYIGPALPHQVEPAWQQISVDLDYFSEKPTKYPPDWANRVVWKDIYWLGTSRGWLSGAAAEGGGHDDVGVGVMLPRRTHVDGSKNLANLSRF